MSPLLHFGALRPGTSHSLPLLVPVLADLDPRHAESLLNRLWSKGKLRCDSDIEGLYWANANIGQSISRPRHHTSHNDTCRHIDVAPSTTTEYRQ